MTVITTRTADRLTDMAHKASAMADAIYSTDRQSSDSVRAAADLLATAARRLDLKMRKYACVVAGDSI